MLLTSIIIPIIPINAHDNDNLNANIKDIISNHNGDNDYNDLDDYNNIHNDNHTTKAVENITVMRKMLKK